MYSMSCVPYIFLRWGKSRGGSIKQPSVARLICNAKNRWLVSSPSSTVSSALSGSHNKQPHQRRCCCQPPNLLPLFSICSAAWTKGGLLNLWVYWAQTLHLDLRKLSAIFQPRCTNVTPSEWIMRLRWRCAMQEKKTKAFPISKIISVTLHGFYLG